ncbi:TPA: hypothetical protein I7230_22880 [Vibrio vulnificus]|nr:hypothetical protein [Vibrio vulnificus]HAS6364322.1 hypothetical protein [Vibrio vulnificus]
MLGGKMKRFTDSIRKSVENEDWYGALITALTLPDVCGKLIEPTEHSKSRYVAWFKDWLQPSYTSHIGADRTEHTFLHGEDCYALRCSFLHEGGSNIETQRAQKALEDFYFITPPTNGSVHCNQFNNKLQLQVDTFCLQVADAVDKWAASVDQDLDVQQRMASLLIIHNSQDGVCF